MQLDVLMNQLEGIAIEQTSAANRKSGSGSQHLWSHPCHQAAELIRSLNHSYAQLVDSVVEVRKGETKQAAALRLITEAQTSRGIFHEQKTLDIK